MSAVATAFALTAGLVADLAGGRLAAGSPDTRFESVSIDTRTLAPGALFIAIAGERFDGHDFLPEAIARGAAGVLVSTARRADVGPAAVVQVDDTLAALQRLGQAIRRKSGARLVAITGSAGKTTTKEITAAILAARYRVVKNEGNLNNHIGLPLSLIELRQAPDVAVVELGMNHAGEIRRLVEIAEPDVRVWINVGDAHIGFFGSREAIARAKAEILEHALPSTVVVANGDDPLVMAHVAGASGRRRIFAIDGPGDVVATHVVDAGFDGTRADVGTPAGPLHLSVALPGRATLRNVLAAVTVAVELGVPARDIEARVQAVRPVARRGATYPLSRGARLVDDSYNASPSAVQAMLAALAMTPVAGRRIAVLGEMRELGDRAAELHAVCGRAAVEAGVDELVVIGGPAADALADGAVDAGLSAMRIHRYPTSEAAAPAVPALVGPSDLVLVKGSRGTRTDIVADRLREQVGRL
jgi:UDP-N-acetylmuramoyl-tripeptide--D-alanyl-D-alanine ligase